MSTLFSIDNLIHAAIYLVLGFVLLIANVWFIRLVGNGLRGGELVIVPFQVIGQKDDDGKLASALAYMLQARLRKIGTDLEISQNILMEPPRSAVSRPDGTPTSIIPRIWASPVDIPVKLLDPVNIDVAVGGVQVGKVLPAIQRSIVKSRTLTFTVYYEGERAIITADIDAFQNTGGDALWIEVKKATPDEIVGSIAYELVQRKLANDPANKIEILNRDEFRTLLNILSEAANLNKKVALGRAVKLEFENLLPQAEELAVKVPDWYQLNYLAANLAESAENYNKALTYYTKVDQVIIKQASTATPIDAKIRMPLEEKIKTLYAKTESRRVATQEGAYQKIEADVVYAVKFLNSHFGLNLNIPPVKPIDPPDSRNAFWDGQSFQAPPEVQYLPDVTYHELTYPFIEQVVKLVYQGQSGSIYQSYGDVLASWMKQKKHPGRTAEEEDWLIAPGAIAWIKDEDIPSSKDRSSLRSLKSPGTAYDDPVVGKDPQPAHMKDYVKTNTDNGGVHINSGIPNKAFYETASRISTDVAGEIWIKALPELAPSKYKDFAALAASTYRVAGELHGDNSNEQQVVKEAWESVGVHVRVVNS